MHKIKIAGLMLALCLLSACGDTASERSTNKIEISYEKDEVLPILLTQKNRIEKIYGKNIWDIPMGDMTYKDYFFRDMQRFFEELAVVGVMARERGIDLSAEENLKINQFVEYYRSQFADIKEEYLYTIVKNYYISKKMKVVIYEETGGVSESAARVINVQRIVLNNPELAIEVLNKVNSGEDFMSVAKEYSIDSNIEVSLSHQDVSEETDAMIFALEEGEISDILKEGETFYIYKIVNPYDVEKTALNKEKLIEEKKKESMILAYDAYVEGKEIIFDKEIWDTIAQEFTEAATVADFFDIYKKEFGEE